MVVGSGLSAERNYAITQNFADPSGVACNTAPRTVGAVGEAEAIEQTSFTVSARIPLGKCPVYAVQTPDARRVFVLNRGDDTITVINSQNNTLDAVHAVLKSERTDWSPAIPAFPCRRRPV